MPGTIVLYESPYRIQKLLESGNIKLGQVASDVLGLSGRLMLRAMADGKEHAEKLAELAQGKLKSKKAELRRALEGRLTQVQRWVLGELIGRVEELDAAVRRVETRIGVDWGQVLHYHIGNGLGSGLVLLYWRAVSLFLGGQLTLTHLRQRRSVPLCLHSSSRPPLNVYVLSISMTTNMLNCSSS